MAKAYIANRPVRFDRNYNVGEIIPAEVIAPQMRRKLAEMGRIVCVDMPDDKDDDAQDGEFGDQKETGEFACEICGKICKSQNGLAAHFRTHNEQEQ